MKKKLSFFLAAMLMAANILAVPAFAEDDQPTESSVPTSATEAPKPTETTTPDPEPTTKPSEGSTDSTTAPTEATQPKPCDHVYGDWDADEGNHWKICTSCGHRESSSHSWASETITVAPTCKDPGGKCKVCTVCEGVLVTEIIPQTQNHTYDNACDTKCNVCGGEREVTHAFGKTWTYSGKGHWHTCTVCGAAGEVKDHYPGPAATEEKDQICLTCGMIMMKKKPHSHKWDIKWSSDESSHWYTCTVCQEKDKTAPHTYDDGCDTDCNVCGYVRTAAHTYGPDWIQTDLTHYGICTICGEESPAESHIADNTGTKCSICGYAMEAAEEAHEHDFADDTWGFDEAGHWTICMCGEKDNAGPHVWDDGEKVEKDLILYHCEVCGAEKQEHVEERGFPWLLFAVGGGSLICLIGIVVCVVLIIKNREHED